MLELKKKKLLLVEGRDELLFFKELLKKINKLDEVEIQSIEGISNLSKELKALKVRTGFRANVESMGIVIDADNSVESAFQKVQDLLKNHGYGVPTDLNTFCFENEKCVGVYIMPNNETTGMLEDLCLMSKEDDPAMECVNQFLHCVMTTLSDDNKPTNVSKAKLQAFLSTRKKYVADIGKAAQKGYWDLDHPSLDSLHQFLNEL